MMGESPPCLLAGWPILAVARVGDTMINSIRHLDRKAASSNAETSRVHVGFLPPFGL